jgi:hypothetical protein
MYGKLDHFGAKNTMLTLKNENLLLARDKHSSLLQKSAN